MAKNVMYVVKRKTGGLLSAGIYTGKISKIDDAVKTSADWDDPTKQLAHILTTDQGVVTAWTQNMGYKKFEDLSKKEQASGDFLKAGVQGYAVSLETNERIEDEDKSEMAREIVGNMVACAGVEEGTEIKDDEDLKAALMGKEIGFKVEVKGETSDGKPMVKVTEFYTVEEAEALIAKTEAFTVSA